MRRLLAAGTAMVICLALVSPTLAQEESGEASPEVSPGSVVVTGVMDNSGEPWRLEASDPRVSGEAEFVDLGGSRWTGSGTLTIKGPEGDWSGPVIAVLNEPLDAWVVFHSAEGTDAYEGWAWVNTAFEQGDGRVDVNGVIYQGEAPRQVWSDLVEGPADE